MFAVRILLTLLFITLLFLSYGAHQAIDEDKDSFLNVFPIFVLNTSNKKVPLYSIDRISGSPIGRLEPQGLYQFKFSGKSGRWLYGIWNNKPVVVKDSSREKVILIFDMPLSLNALLNLHWIALILFAISLLFLLKRAASIFQLKTKIESVEAELEIKNQKLKQLILEKNHYRDRNDTLCTDLIKVKRRLSEVEYEEAQSRKKLSALRYKLKNYDLLKCWIKEEFEKKEAELRCAFEQASKNKNSAELSSLLEKQQSDYTILESNYKNLKSEYQKLKKEGLIFGVDFDGDRYENLLKGRKYELFFVNELLDSSDFEVLSWTPDKGFENGIYVKSNGDPDLLIQYQGKLKFAVECKYRGQFYKNNTPLKVDWGYCVQANRYIEYEKEEQIPVFVAIGIKGSPDKPEYNYVVPIDRLVERSKNLRWKNEPEYELQKVIEILDIEDCVINKENSLEQYLLSYVNKNC